MLFNAPEAVWIALFRPYIWEANNFVMFLAGVENLLLLALVIFVLIRLGPIRTFRRIISEPYVFFSLIFTVAFAFAIGISTFNFGTLVRYKIPMLPFFMSFLLILLSYRSKSSRKEEVAEFRESLATILSRDLEPILILSSWSLISLSRESIIDLSLSTINPLISCSMI